MGTNERRDIRDCCSIGSEDLVDMVIDSSGVRSYRYNREKESLE